MKQKLTLLYQISHSVQQHATDCMLWGTNPCGARFSSPIQKGPEGHPKSHWSTEAFSWVKRPRSSLDHPPTSSAEVKEKLQLYLHFKSGSKSSIVGRNLTLHLQATYCAVFWICLYCYYLWWQSCTTDTLTLSCIKYSLANSVYNVHST